ncbi:hypothetical protein LTR28_012313, partial [Elasticomyces elasticus]
MRQWRLPCLAIPHSRALHTSAKPSDAHKSIPPLIDIKNATFYHRYPSPTNTLEPTNNPPIFPNLTFSLPAHHSSSSAEAAQHWSVLSHSSLARTTFLQILNGQHICIPPGARLYPYLSSDHVTATRPRTPQNAIKYVGFDAERRGLGGTSVQGAYLSARYESRKEETDFSLADYLRGNTELNALERDESDLDAARMERIVAGLRLHSLLRMPVSNLSNGQTRRARIAKALMAEPLLLLLDGPFMGLDPPTAKMLSRVLEGVAAASKPRLVLSLRPEDVVPEWISHLILVDETLRVRGQGPKEEILQYLNIDENVAHENDTEVKNFQVPAAHARSKAAGTPVSKPGTTKFSRDGLPPTHRPSSPPGEPLIEMAGVQVCYGSKSVLGDWTQPSASSPGLHWTVRRGSRWGIFGPNGSGKTTLLSLITSDHPQTYSAPLRLFGKKRLPRPGEPGISLFEIQRRMGHSSPEVHAYFPKGLSVR